MPDAGSWSDEGMERERWEWVFAPVACAALLTAGAVAGVLRGLRHGGRDECGGIPLPRCRWLTSRWAVRLACWFGLTAGLADLIIASVFFLHGWDDDDVPPVLLSAVLATYVLLAAAPVIWLAGLTWRDVPAVHVAFVQVGKIALLGGLAAGLASEVLCETGEPESLVSPEWRKGCATLGASAGLLLLGLYGMQADVQDGQLPLPTTRVPPEAEDEEGLPGHSSPGHIRQRWPSWRRFKTEDFDFPAGRPPGFSGPEPPRPGLGPLGDPGLSAPLLGPPPPAPPVMPPREVPRGPPPGHLSLDFAEAPGPLSLDFPEEGLAAGPGEFFSPGKGLGLQSPVFARGSQAATCAIEARQDSLPASTPSTCASPVGGTEEAGRLQPLLSHGGSGRHLQP